MCEKNQANLAAIQPNKLAESKVVIRHLGVKFVGFLADSHLSTKVNYCVHGFALGSCPSGCQE
jgi:hypothetical protein